VACARLGKGHRLQERLGRVREDSVQVWRCGSVRGPSVGAAVDPSAPICLLLLVRVPQAGLPREEQGAAEHVLAGTQKVDKGGAGGANDTAQLLLGVHAASFNSVTTLPISVINTRIQTTPLGQSKVGFVVNKQLEGGGVLTRFFFWPLGYYRNLPGDCQGRGYPRAVEGHPASTHP